jgi:uncharacterized protein YndB with AHSA1/START domain
VSERSLSVRRSVAAPPERVYEAVSDLGPMAAWSQEYVGSWRFWRGPARPGVRFVGWNRHGWRLWCTTCRVLAADRPTRFAFRSSVFGLPVARWSYLITATPDGGSEVVEEWSDLRGAGPAGSVTRWLGRAVTGTTAPARVERNAEGMRVTLARLAAELKPATPPAHPAG